ncbi:hypothetical protein BCR42DRAFT_430076 [Absidia repens]|uniref:Uncharacterized protein n=1 Tax=Absidia repens TaxID=90262 RepID=A0A1X2HLV5_9FUNG|nr:hypothetical protein BCR42DRAFT_430076 [Absidia repens]
MYSFTPPTPFPLFFLSSCVYIYICFRKKKENHPFHFPHIKFFSFFFFVTFNYCIYALQTFHIIPKYSFYTSFLPLLFLLYTISA